MAQSQAQQKPAQTSFAPRTPPGRKDIAAKEQVAQSGEVSQGQPPKPGEDIKETIEDGRMEGKGVKRRKLA